MLKSRLDTLARQVNAVAPPPRQQSAADPVEEALARFLAYLPDDLRPAIVERLRDPDTLLAGWYLWPFARWAVVPDDFTFPRALVRFVLDTPPGWPCFLHGCERCGLHVPLVYENGKSYPTRDPPFPLCPACGGRTGFMATYEKAKDD